jgi:hypothetical protein
MAWRQQGSTGSNNIPLGNRRRFGGDSASPRDDGGYNQSEAPSFKRGRSPTRGMYPSSYKRYAQLTSLQSKMNLPKMDPDAARRETVGATRPRTRLLVLWAFQQRSWQI